MVGINLLREGLDLPEVSLVAILDADKEGFLRSHRSLTQTAGRAARNVNGKVIMYADNITESMRQTIEETERRRSKQIAYNEANGITPQQIVKNIPQRPASEEETKSSKPVAYIEPEDKYSAMAAEPVIQHMTKQQIETAIATATTRMKEAAKSLDFMLAAQYRDEIVALQKQLENL